MSTAKVFLLASVIGLLLAAPATRAQSGLRLGDAAQQAQENTWARWQARFGLATTHSAIDAGNRWQLSAGQLLGDYYWSGLRPAGVGRGGGFRATSGLLFGQRSLALGTPALASAQGLGLTLSRSVRLAAIAGEISSEAWSAVPYVGVGYSGVSLRGGWGFTADVGLVGTTSGLRARRDGALGTQGVDDLLRELRLTPVLQFGASYAF
ncbi:MAG: hypothetical protein Q8L49_06130 [Burkholderiaceae bacterium]|nr:hypothetical protein [Burkholderiaceae bacterium]